MSKEQIEAVELNIQEAKKFIELANSLERLKANRDFKAVVLDGYFEKEAIRLVHLKSAPAFQTPERQASIIKQIDGIGALSDFFQVVRFNSNSAARAIEADEATLEELNSEALIHGGPNYD